MSCSVILKKDQHWYLIPESENTWEVIRSIVERENPEYAADGELDELLSSSGWQLEEYVDMAGVA